MLRGPGTPLASWVVVRVGLYMAAWMSEIVGSILKIIMSLFEWEVIEPKYWPLFILELPLMVIGYDTIIYILLSIR